MLEHLSQSLIELILLTATAAVLTSVLYGKISKRRIEEKRKQWELEDRQRVDVINQNLTGGRDA